MKLSALILVMGLAGSAQVLTLTGPAGVKPGQVSTLTLGLSGSAGQNLSALQWSVTPPSGTTLSSMTAGAASTTAAKTIWCNSSATLCLGIGVSPANPPVLTNSLYADGVVAIMQFAVPAAAQPGVLNLPLTGLAGVSNSGSALTVTSGTVYSVRVYSKCDIDSSGTVDGTDVLLVLQPLLGNGACPLTGGCTLQSLFAVFLAASGGSCTL